MLTVTGGWRALAVLLVSIGVGATAAAQPRPVRVLRPTPGEVLVRYAAELTPDDGPAVILVTWGGLHRGLEAEVAANEVIVALPPEIADELDALGRASPPGAAFVIFDELTLAGRTWRNLIAEVPISFRAELEGDVRNTTTLNVDYMPVSHRQRALQPSAWVVEIDGQPFTINRIAPVPRFSNTEARSSEEPIVILTLTIDGAIPYGTTASVFFQERPDAERRLVASGRTPGPPPGHIASILQNVDIHTGFMFAYSRGVDPTFGLTTRFQRPFLFSAFGVRNQVAVGPRASLRTNSADQDDEDSVILSVPVEFRRFRGPLLLQEGPEAPLVNTLVFDVGPTLEAEKSFGNRNLVSDGRLTFLFSTLGSMDATFDLQSYVGFEVGRTFGGTAERRLDDTISRVKAGVIAQARFQVGAPHLQEIVLDFDYVYRRLYTEESMSRWVPVPRGTMVNGEVGDVLRRELQAVAGGNYRRYVNAAIRFAFGPNWEVVGSYVNGELPPRFISVDKFQAGFAFRFGDSF